jgi:hypothetical protein
MFSPPFGPELQNEDSYHSYLYVKESKMVVIYEPDMKG